MNLFSNYLDCAKLAKLHLAQAEDDMAKGKDSRAIHNLSEAVRLAIQAQNNVAQMAFRARRRKK
jgi:hypothetical protein